MKSRHRTISSYLNSLKLNAKAKTMGTLRAMDTTSFAKKVEDYFIPSNVFIRTIIALVSYMFILGPSAKPTVGSVLLFFSFMTVAFIAMDIIKKKSTDKEKFDINLMKAVFVAMPVALFIAKAAGMPSAFMFAIFTFMVIVPAIFLINSNWKISGHMCMFAAMTTILSMVNVLLFAPMFLMLPLISWSRLKLRAHTKSQIIAGMTIGLVVPLVFSVIIQMI